jgi:hypothetical protein
MKAKPNSKKAELKPRTSPPEENGDAAALDRAMEGTKLLALGRVFAQDKVSISRVRAFAQDLLSAVHPDEEKINPLPEHPISNRDIDFPIPPITREEVGEFIYARDAFLRASWDYRRRRAEIAYKLSMLCHYEDQSQRAEFLIRLDDDGQTIIITDRANGAEELIVDRG